MDNYGYTPLSCYEYQKILLLLLLLLAKYDVEALESNKNKTESNLHIQ